jgi:hypothetical protein
MGPLGEVDWTAVAAVATLLAVVAAFATPYLGARIERQRLRAAAVRLAELTVRTIDMLATLHGAAGGDPVPNAMDAARSLDLPSLLDRMATLPSADIDDADALEAFIRIAGLARSAQSMSATILNVKPGPSVDMAQRLLDEFPLLREQAASELKTLKARLVGRH